MSFFLYLLAGLIILGAALAVLPVEFRIRYGREGEEDLLRLDLHIWPGISYGFKFVMIDFSSTVISSVLRFRGEFLKGGKRSEFRKTYSLAELSGAIKHMQTLTHLYKTVKPALGYMLSRVTLVKFSWKTGLGAGDPYYTGLAAALAWSLEGFFTTALCSRLKTTGPPFFAVIPDFNRQCLDIRLDCILKTRTGYIIFTGMRIFAALLTCGKAGVFFKMIKRPGRRYDYARASH